MFAEALKIPFIKWELEGLSYQTTFSSDVWGGAFLKEAKG